MRLINADALMKRLKAWDTNDATDKALYNFALDRVLEAPTVEPERKKGEWVPEFDGKFTGGAYWFSCSKCKRIVPEVRNGGWNFCPNCGADMRGKHDERAN